MTSVAANSNVSLGIYALTHPSRSCFPAVIQYLGFFFFFSKVPFLHKFTILTNLTVLSPPRSCLEVRKINSLLTEC